MHYYHLKNYKQSQFIKIHLFHLLCNLLIPKIDTMVYYHVLNHVINLEMFCLIYIQITFISILMQTVHLL